MNKASKGVDMRMPSDWETKGVGLNEGKVRVINGIAFKVLGKGGN